MSKITLNNVGDITQATTAAALINANSSVIETAFDNTLSRDGTSPNPMLANIDMNSQRILNLPSPLTSSEPLRLLDLNTFNGGGTITNIPAGGASGAVLTKTSSSDYVVGWANDSSLVSAGTNLTASGTNPVTLSTINSPTFPGTVTANTFLGTLGSGTVLVNPVINGTITGTGVAVAATPNTLVLRDGGGNATVNSAISGYTTTVTAAGTTVLTVNSTYNQYFTGATTQTITLPVTSTLVLGQSYRIVNLSTGAVTTQSSGANTVVIVPGNGCSAVITCILTSGTTAASWSVSADQELTVSGKVLNISNSLTLAGTDATTLTFQGTDTYVGRATTDTLTNKTLTSPTLTTPALGSPSSVGTMPAFTLGGTISGGGNQLNNIIIGTTTPLAGTFTALTASTSITSPLHYGGSAVGSTHTVNGTSNGSPANAYTIIQSNGQNTGVGGQSTPLALLHVGPGNDVSSLSPQFYVSANGTTAFCVRDSTNDLEFGMFTNSAPAAIVLGSRSNTQLVFQTNSVNIATFFPSGGFNLGPLSGTDPGAGSILATASIKSSAATSGIGYATGAGGTVTQGTSRTTGVTLNTVSGAITLFSQVNSAISQATAQSFTVTNSAVAATDVVIVSQKSGTDKYEIFVTNVAAGSFQITNYTVAGTTNEAPVFNFVIIKGVTS